MTRLLFGILSTIPSAKMIHLSIPYGRCPILLIRSVNFPTFHCYIQSEADYGGIVYHLMDNT